MPEPPDTITAKTGELKEELKDSGLWQNSSPAWVNWYNDDSSMEKTNFAEWLQFVFIPNHLQKNNTSTIAEKKLIVLPAIKYFGPDVIKGKLLQILIEIDSLL